MKFKTIFVILSLLLFVSSSFSEIVKEDNKPTLRKKSQAGLRLGAWINSGDLPPSAFSIPDDSTIGFNTSFNSGSFYFEGFYSYNFYSILVSEISFGVSSRGDVTVFDGLNTDIGTLNIYPILLHLKVYPMINSNSRIQPYFGVGGGMYYAHRTVQFIVGNYYNYYELEGESETDLNYTLEGGFDYLLSQRFALDFNFKYMPIEFSDPLLTVKDYSASTITVGFKYLTGK